MGRIKMIGELKNGNSILLGEYFSDINGNNYEWAELKEFCPVTECTDAGTFDNTPVSSIVFSDNKVIETRIHNALFCAGYDTVEELRRLSPRDFGCLRNVGKMCTEAFETWINNYKKEE